MLSVEELRAGIQQRQAERELAVKKMLDDIQEKIKAIENYRKNFYTK
jgi:hypothetical protein